MPKVEYTNEKGLVQKAGSGGININSGRLRQVLTVTDVNARHNTLTAAQANAGIVLHTSVTGGGTLTADTAANYIANCGLDSDGQCLEVFYVNDGSQTVTVNGAATGITFVDAGNTILTNEAAVILIQRVTSTTCKIFVVQ
tara:strand:+ start:38 stop:460 length:423 start_codon:yes stop_codon:yes gene_type:complete